MLGRVGVLVAQWCGVLVKPVFSLVCGAALLAGALTAAAQVDDGAETSDSAVSITVVAGPLGHSLNALSGAYDVNILFASSLVAGRSAPLLSGRLNLDEALEKLLDDQALRAVRIDATTIAIIADEPSQTPASPERRDLAPGPAPVPLMSLEPDASLRADPIIVTGTRAPARTVFQSLSPIEVIGAPELQQTASDELLDSLALTLPSFTAFRFPLNDGNIFNRPTALRGLSSDHTLVLVNGRRRHRSAFLETTNGHAVDLSQLPITAIKRVELLRDGASAQYGSDAIGGVINVILEDTPGASAFSQYASYYEGDGESWRGGARFGRETISGGFAVMSFEVFDTNPTSRSRQRLDAIEFEATNPEVEVPDPVQHWGQPEREGWRIGWNAALPLGAEGEVYGFGTLSETSGLSDFNWRNPDIARAFDPSEAYPDFDLRTIYPAGFTPRFGQEETDYSAFLGLRSGAVQTWRWDLSAGFGENEIDYVLYDSINASLGPDSPTRFRPGRLKQSEFVFNVDLSRQLNTANGAANLAAGLEYREARYTVRAGDPASFAVGPGAADGLPPGSNGFPGYTPEQAGTSEQDSAAVWIDVEWPVETDWRLGTALRYEDYSLFGETLNGKLSARYELSPKWVLRSTFSTGFRAPTAGQVFSERTSQLLDGATLDIVTAGRFSPESAAAEIVSARPGVYIAPLEPETSVNLTAGLAYRNSGGLTVTLDVYQIDIDDRLALSEDFFLTNEERVLLAQRDPSSEDVSEVDFFQNLFDTRSRGVDLVVTKDFAVGAGDLGLTLAYNFNDTEITDAAFLGPDVSEAELLAYPLLEHRGALSATYTIGDVEFFGRMRYFGEWTDELGQANAPIQTFGARSFFDVGLTWRVSDVFALKLGAENIFDTYPGEALRQANRGLIYTRNAPYDTDGGLYYVRLSTSF